MFQPTVAAAQHKLAASRTVQSGQAHVAYDGSATFAAALSFPPQPAAMRRAVYDSLLAAYSQPSDAHALVERVVTGAAAQHRADLAEGIHLADALPQAVTINEIRELCTHLTDQLNDAETLPSQAEDPVDPMTGETVMALHGTWRAADDVLASTRDIALMGIMTAFLDKHFEDVGHRYADEKPTIESVFGVPDEVALEAAQGDAVQVRSQFTACTKKKHNKNLQTF